MTTINPNPNEQPLKPLHQRLEIKEGMTVKEVQEKGNLAQKAAATIFDVNGDGKYDYQEAYNFSHTKITNDPNKGEIRLYDENGKKLQRTVNIESEKQDYVKRTAQRQKFEQAMTRFGLDIDNAEWVGINDCEVKTIKGKTYLILKARSENNMDNYDLSIPIDSSFEPSKIEMYRAEDDANIHFNNLKGTLTILGDSESSVGFAFGGNSNVTVIGRDGLSDYIAIEDKATVSVKTTDYADIVDNRKKPNKDFIHLKPGTTNF